jgi:hypothetical protein
MKRSVAPEQKQLSIFRAEPGARRPKWGFSTVSDQFQTPIWHRFTTMLFDIRAKGNGNPMYCFRTDLKILRTELRIFLSLHIVSGLISVFFPDVLFRLI